MTAGARREITHFRSCNLCEAMCGLEIRAVDGEVVDLRGDAADPFSRGHVCPKAVALQDIHTDPDRLRHPVRKTADGGWQRIGWDEAFDLAALGLRRVQERHGRDAVGIYAGNPSVHNYGTLLYGPPLMRALKTKHRYSATSVDQLPHHFASYFMFGHVLLLPVPDLDRTRFFLCLGGNPAVSNGSLMTAPDVKKRLKAIRERGGRVVVVDPRRTETAALADDHLHVRPGTDAWLLLSMLQVLFAEGLADPGRLAAFTDGVEEIREIAATFPPEETDVVTGVPAAAVRDLARDFAAASGEEGGAVCYGRIGLSTQEFGGLCQWLVQVVNVVTGNLDRPGGAMFPRPAVDIVAAKKRGGSYRRWQSHVRGLPEFMGELPVASLAEDMEAGAIRGLVTSAGNPVLSTPEGDRLGRALKDADFVLSIDFYVNETTRHADVILPPTAALEHDHYDLVFHALAIRDTSRYNPPLFPPGEDTRHDWQILLELEKRLNRKPKPAHRLWRLAAGRGPRFLLDLALRTGPYGRGFLPWRRGLSVKELEKHPHGVDLGALKPCLPDRLRTADRRIDLAPEVLVEDVERLRRRGGEVAAWASRHGSLTLIGRRQVRSNNSWMHNYRRLMKGGDRCTLLMHPDDAAGRGLADGDRVRLASGAGAVEVPLEVTDAMMPGVVSMPHGFGHGGDGVELEVARAQPGASVNDVNQASRVDQLTGNAAFSGQPVEVRAVESR